MAGGAGAVAQGHVDVVAPAAAEPAGPLADQPEAAAVRKLLRQDDLGAGQRAGLERLGGQMTRRDDAALKLAIAQMRQESPEARARIDRVLREEGFESAGLTAVYHRQCRTLR